MSGSGRVTLRDVADASGVSRATVSFVLNDAPNQTISAATRERVQRAARELGYTPHALGRALREGTSRIVVLNVDVGMDGSYSRSYIRGLDDELATHGHILLVRYGHTGPDADRQVVDAVAPRAVLRLAEPYLSGRAFAEEGWETRFPANAALQLQYLVDHGHTRIAMAVPEGPAPLVPVRLRFAAETTDALGLEPVVPFVVPRPRESGVQALRALREAHGDVTAVACLNDEVGFRVLTAMNDLGLSAPRDLAVIGYDETAVGELTSPSLTTVRIDAEGNGRIAARTVLGLSTEDLHESPGTVVVRDSV